MKSIVALLVLAVLATAASGFNNGFYIKGFSGGHSGKGYAGVGGYGGKYAYQGRYHGRSQ